MMISDAAFNSIADIVMQRSGISLSPTKAYLLQSRLSGVARQHGFAAVADMAERAATQGLTPKICDDISEAMLNNETFFFRDSVPFETLDEAVFPALRAARQSTKTIRIWSAAASTGQEAYSIAMLFAEEAARWEGWNIEIVGTDLSPSAVERAKSARFSQFEVQRGLTIRRLMRFFVKENEHWVLKPEIRSMVQFKVMNLCEAWSLSGQFDIILCRNVLMYLTAEHKTSILERMAQKLAPDGRLLLGAAETVIGITEQLVPDWENRGLYLAANPVSMSA